MIKPYLILVLLTIFVSACVAQTYKYDAANRLVQVSSNCSGTLYTYDPNGNRLSINQISILTTSTVIDEYCGNDGRIVLKPKDTTAKYRYQWSNGQTTATIKNLKGGTYSVVITEPISGFTCSQAFTVNPIIKDSLQIITTQVTCISGGNGKAKVKIITPYPKGTYSYQWKAGTDTSYSPIDSITTLKAGNYSVNIKNSYTGCVKTIAYIISQPPRFLTGVTSSVPTCYRSNDATAQAQVAGNANLYTFSWTGPANTVKSTQNITGLSPGTYIVAVTQKATGCILADTVVINETPAYSSITKTDSKCYQANNGTAKVIVPNNPSQYSYTWTGQFTGIRTTQQITGLAPGLYRVTVTDNFGNHCSEKDSVTITEPPNILKDVVVTSATCKGQSDGIAEAIVSGSVTQYSYIWYSNTEGRTLPQTQYKATGLKAGTYTLTIQSAAPNVCTAIKQFTVQDAHIDLSSILYPNPTSGKVTIKICSLITGAITYSVFTSSGQLLKNGTVQNSNGVLSLDLSNFPPATYAVALVVDGVKYNFGVIKI